MTPTRIDEAGWPAAAAVVTDVRRRHLVAGEDDPLDEAAALRLKHHGVRGSELWLIDNQGFAFAHGGVVALAVAPDARGRGLGGALAEVTLAGTAPVSAWSHGDHPAAARLAEKHGLARERELWVMRRPTHLPLEAAPAPEGVRIRRFADEDDQDATEIVRVNAAAFAHHREQGSMDLLELGERMAEPWFDPAGLIVADDGHGRVLGFHWTKQHSADLGEVYVVAIDPAAQGRGLGRVLTLAGLRHLAGLGVAEVMLYVESDNLPARSLYERLGFTHDASDTHVQYHRG